MRLALQEPQEADGFGTENWSLEQWESLSRSSIVSWKACDGEEFLGCAGILKIWEGRGFAWMAVSRKVGRFHMLAIHRRTMAVINTATDLGLYRLETTVRTGFAAGRRWALMLGFEREGTMRRYAPDGGDHDLYARVVC